MEIRLAKESEAQILTAMSKKAFDTDVLVGGALLFHDDQNKEIMYVGRIFIDPKHHKKDMGWR